MIDPGRMKMEPGEVGSVNIKQEVNPDSTSGNTPKKKPGRPRKIKQESDIKKEPKVKKEPKIKQEPKMKQEKITDHLTVKKKRKVDRFKGMSEEEVAKRLLPDHLAPNLDIVIVGINPGLYAAFVGHHYAGPGNHFWKCMFLSGLIPEQMNAMQDFKLLDYGIGFTNIVARTTRGSADLSRKEIKEGAQILAEKLNKYKPKIAVFNGKGIYEVFLGHKKFYFGKQPEPLAGTDTAVYVMPSSSARCSQLPRAVDKVPFYAALKKFRDHLRGDLPDLKEEEITFPDLELKTVKKEKKEEGELYPGEVNPNLPPGIPDEINRLCGFTQGNYDVIPHGASTAANQSQVTSNASQFSAVTIKQEPGTSTVSEMPMLTQIKQEPGVSPATSYCTFSQSNVSSHGQFGMYSQPAMSSESNPMPNSLNGLFGLLGQVTGSSSQSNFGFVNQADPANKQLQFNDALCDIVKEGSVLELPADTGDLTEESQSQGGKPKARKRKKKSDDSAEISTRSPPQFVQHLSPHTSPSNSNLPPFSQPDAESVYQPLQAYNPHMYTQAIPSNIAQAPPFCLSFPHPSAMSFSQSFAGGNPFHPPGSFTQMMGGDFNAAGIPHTSGSSIPFTMANHQSGIPHTSGSSIPFTMANHQSGIPHTSGSSIPFTMANHQSGIPYTSGSSIPFTIANGQTSATGGNSMHGAMPFGNISIKQEKMDD